MTQSGSTTPENQMAGANALVSEPAAIHLTLTIHSRECMVK